MWLVKIVSLKLIETCHQSRGREWRGIDAEREFQRATISAGESLSCVTQPRVPARIRASMIETVFCRAFTKTHDVHLTIEMKARGTAIAFHEAIVPTGIVSQLDQSTIEMQLMR